MPGNKTYPDLKYKFIRYLIEYEKRQRKFGYLKAAAEWTSRAIVSLDLTEGEIRSVKQGEQLEAIGAVISDELKNAKVSKHKSEPPAKGYYASSGAGLIVALYDLTQEARLNNPENDVPLIHHEELRERCQGICEETFLDASPSSVPFSIPRLCNAWWRINILEARQYVKKRSRSKETVYELLPAGAALAERLRGAVLFQDLDIPPYPVPAKDALYTTDDGGDGIVMWVDSRELGGDGRRLFTLTNLLTKYDIKFKTSVLPVGDYNWFYRKNGEEVCLPVMVERKRGDDMAESLKDGRYERQKNKMKQWRDRFGTNSKSVQLVYIIEGSIEKYVVQCGHECVGKCGNPGLLETMGALGELENDSSFAVLYTQHVEDSVHCLVNISTELKMRLNDGEFDALFTAYGVQGNGGAKRLAKNPTVQMSFNTHTIRNYSASNALASKTISVDKGSHLSSGSKRYTDKESSVYTTTEMSPRKKHWNELRRTNEITSSIHARGNLTDSTSPRKVFTKIKNVEKESSVDKVMEVFDLTHEDKVINLTDEGVSLDRRKRNFTCAADTLPGCSKEASNNKNSFQGNFGSDRIYTKVNGGNSYVIDAKHPRTDGTSCLISLEQDTNNIYSLAQRTSTNEDDDVKIVGESPAKLRASGTSNHEVVNTPSKVSRSNDVSFKKLVKHYRDKKRSKPLFAYENSQSSNDGDNDQLSASERNCTITLQDEALPRDNTPSVMKVDVISHLDDGKCHRMSGVDFHVDIDGSQLLQISAFTSPGWTQSQSRSHMDTPFRENRSSTKTYVDKRMNVSDTSIPHDTVMRSMEKLKSIFPYKTLDEIFNVLWDVNNNEELAIEKLLS